jgi:putative hemolysin
VYRAAGPSSPRQGPCLAETAPGRNTVILFEIVVILSLILLNAIFAGAEIAVVALRKTRLQQLAEEKRAGAAALAALRGQPERFLATVQVGITVVGATAAAFGGVSIASRIASVLARVPWLAHYAEDLALTLVVAAVSYLSIVLGELVPKSLALRGAERYALLVARPMLALSQLARPLVWFLTASSNAVLKPFGDRTTFSEVRMNAEELKQLVHEATQSGALDLRTGEIASRALEFGQLLAKDVMVPRNRMLVLSIEATQEELRRILLEDRHSRMPVYKGALDNIVGYIALQDVLALAWDHELIVLADLVQPAYFVPETVPAVKVLQELQRRQIRLAIVVDEHGGVSGLISFRDLMEELVGEILGEREAPEPLVKKVGDNTAVVRGAAPIRDVNRTLGLALKEDEDFTTIAGLCISLAGGIPAKGAILTTEDGTRIEVLDASPSIVRQVRLSSGNAPPAIHGA